MLLLFTLFSSMYPYVMAYDSCYVFEMEDSWGDGWNGGTLKVYVDPDGASASSNMADVEINSQFILENSYWTNYLSTPLNKRGYYEITLHDGFEDSVAICGVISVGVGNQGQYNYEWALNVYPYTRATDYTWSRGPSEFSVPFSDTTGFRTKGSYSKCFGEGTVWTGTQCAVPVETCSENSIWNDVSIETGECSQCPSETPIAQDNRCFSCPVDEWGSATSWDAASSTCKAAVCDGGITYEVTLYDHLSDTWDGNGNIIVKGKKRGEASIENHVLAPPNYANMYTVRFCAIDHIKPGTRGTHLTERAITVTECDITKKTDGDGVDPSTGRCDKYLFRMCAYGEYLDGCSKVNSFVNILGDESICADNCEYHTDENCLGKCANIAVWDWWSQSDTKYCVTSNNECEFVDLCIAGANGQTCQNVELARGIIFTEEDGSVNDDNCRCECYDFDNDQVCDHEACNIVGCTPTELSDAYAALESGSGGACQDGSGAQEHTKDFGRCYTEECSPEVLLDAFGACVE